jgi:exosortase E/protease (VPEID-CTERM system)
LLTLLLVAELLGLSIYFDASVRAADPGWAGTFLFWSARLAHLLLAGLVMLVVLGAWRLRGELSGGPHSRSAALWTVGHLLALIAFVWCTQRVLGRDSATTTVGPFELAAWVITGSLMLLLWAAAAVAPRRWLRIARKGWGIAVAAIAGAAIVGVVLQTAHQGWDVLSAPTLSASHALLKTLTTDTICDPSARVLGTTRFQVEVAPSCSGYEGMALALVYLSGYLWLFRRTLQFPQSLLLLPLGLLAVWLANVARIATLIVIGDRVSPELALGGFHSQAGWLGFNAIVIGLALIAHRSRLLLRDLENYESPKHQTSTLAYLAPLMAALAVHMVAGASLSDPSILYPVRAAATAILLIWFRRQYESLHFRSGWSFAALSFSLIAGVLVFLLWRELTSYESSRESASPPPELSGWPEWSRIAWTSIRLLGFVVITPLAEELAFRGYLMRRLVNADFQSVPISTFTWLSFILSSLVFGFLHDRWLAATLAGMAFALVAQRTKQLKYAFIAHACTNALLVLSGMTRAGL